MLGDKAYDSAELREDLHERGTKPVIPNRCNREQPSASYASGEGHIADVRPNRKS
jgi:IS5 family transposase